MIIDNNKRYMFMDIIKHIKAHGFVETLRKGIKIVLGINNQLNEQQESIDTLFYYMNNFVVDASTLPPAKDPDLRIMQQCDAALMNILDKIFKKYKLTYWLDFGTLLGAYRHRGLIPWDDDMDISMPREDYDKLIDVLKKELDTDVFDVSMSNGRIGIGYRHNKTGIWCDVFPVDVHRTSLELEPAIEVLKDKISQYRIFYTKSIEKPYDEMQQQRRAIIADEENATSEIIYHGREFPHNHPRAFYLSEEIYPITEIEFEGYVFSAPAKTPAYLEKIYGENYMQLPKVGILHHDEGRGPLSTWARRHNVDMKQVLAYLKEYVNRF